MTGYDNEKARGTTIISASRTEKMPAAKAAARSIWAPNG
jgi:hypothetical protein